MCPPTTSLSSSSSATTSAPSTKKSMPQIGKTLVDLDNTHVEEEGFDKLLTVSSNRQQWASLSHEDKLQYLEEILDIMTNQLGYDSFKACGIKGAQMMGFDPMNTAEGDFEAEGQVLSWVVILKKHLEDMIYTYKILSKKEAVPTKLTKGNYETRIGPNGQLVVNTFPVFPGEKSGFLSDVKGECWLDPNVVKTADQLEDAFNPDIGWDDRVTAADDKDGDGGGLMLVLGAGNQVALTAIDILQGLFVRNHVVYMKQHPLRDYANDIVSQLYRPLIDAGYLGLEYHTSNDRSSSLVYHPDVTAVHLTGGKPTHDMLVWGIDETERNQNLKANTPKLKAHMTSELGAVSPWIVVPATYTLPQLETQAKLLAHFIHSNASCNCNAPKCVVVADDWDQKTTFLQLVEDALANHVLPAAYYPGIQQRWDKFATQYPDAKRIDTKTGLGIEERQLSAAKFATKPLLLPYLQINVDVDLESEVGRESASKEFAFRTEPFAPMYTVATMKGTSHKDTMKFGTLVSKFCNEYLFGTLSCSMTCEPSLVEDDGVQSMIADLKYGSIAVNKWAGLNYLAQSSGQWAAYPGETLDNVQSGIGRIGNMIGLPGLQKFVTYGAITGPNQSELKMDMRKEQRLLEAVCRFTLNGTVGNLMNLLSEVTGVNLKSVAATSVSILVAGIAFLVTRT